VNIAVLDGVVIVWTIAFVVVAVAVEVTLTVDLMKVEQKELARAFSLGSRSLLRTFSCLLQASCHCALAEHLWRRKTAIELTTRNGKDGLNSQSGNEQAGEREMHCEPYACVCFRLNQPGVERVLVLTRYRALARPRPYPIALIIPNEALTFSIDSWLLTYAAKLSHGLLCWLCSAWKRIKGARYDLFPW
jgi:hypothetical protein